MSTLNLWAEKRETKRPRGDGRRLTRVTAEGSLLYPAGRSGSQGEPLRGGEQLSVAGTLHLEESGSRDEQPKAGHGHVAKMVRRLCRPTRWRKRFGRFPNWTKSCARRSSQRASALSLGLDFNHSGETGIQDTKTLNLRTMKLKRSHSTCQQSVTPTM